MEGSYSGEFRGAPAKAFGPGTQTWTSRLQPGADQRLERRVYRVGQEPGVQEVREHEHCRGRQTDGQAPGRCHARHRGGGWLGGGILLGSTQFLMKVRDHDIMSLEAAHWRLSTQPALCAGFKNRGTLREGALADIVIYDLNKLDEKPMEIVHDFPGGEWRRVKRAEGYRQILINGQVTLEDGKPTGNMSGRLLRYG